MTKRRRIRARGLGVKIEISMDCVCDFGLSEEAFPGHQRSTSRTLIYIHFRPARTPLCSAGTYASKRGSRRLRLPGNTALDPMTDKLHNSRRSRLPRRKPSTDATEREKDRGESSTAHLPAELARTRLGRVPGQRRLQVPKCTAEASVTEGRSEPLGRRDGV